MYLLFRFNFGKAHQPHDSHLRTLRGGRIGTPAAYDDGLLLLLLLLVFKEE